MKTARMLLPLLISLASNTLLAENLDQDAAIAQIGQVLTCKRAVSPGQFAELVTAAKGKAMVQASELSDAEYTVPKPVEVFGRPITRLSVHDAGDGEGDFNEYTGQFSGESLQTVAKLGNIAQDDLGHYTKEVGKHDLSLRAEGGSAVISCANNKR